MVAVKISIILNQPQIENKELMDPMSILSDVQNVGKYIQLEIITILEK